MANVADAKIGVPVATIDNDIFATHHFALAECITAYHSQMDCKKAPAKQLRADENGKESAVDSTVLSQKRNKSVKWTPVEAETFPIKS